MSGIEFVGIILGMTSALGRLISALQEERGSLQKHHSYSQKLSVSAVLLDEVNTIVTNADAPPTKTAEIFLHNCQHELKVIEACYTGSNPYESRIFPTAQTGLTRPFLLDQHVIDQEALRDSLIGFESSVALLHNIVSRTEMHRQLSDLQVQHQQNSRRMEYLIRARGHDESDMGAQPEFSSKEDPQAPERYSDDKTPLKVTGGMLDGFLVNDGSASRIETTLAQLKILKSGRSKQTDLGQAISSLERATGIPSFVPVRFLVDTGSDVNIVSRDFINRNNLNGMVKLSSPKVITGASRDMVTQSTFTIKFTWRHKADANPRTDVFQVLENSTHDAVLGRPFWNDIDLHIMRDITFWNAPVENHQVNSIISFPWRPKSTRAEDERNESVHNGDAKTKTQCSLAKEMAANMSLEGTYEPEPHPRRPSRSTINDELQRVRTPPSNPLPPNRALSEEIRASLIKATFKPASSEKVPRVVITPQPTPQGNDRHAEVKKAKGDKPRKRWRLKRSKRTNPES